jgi:hypothetical protein
MTDTVSARARELLRGAIDTHVHISPDVVGRKIDDLSLARRCLELGLGGFLMKSHYTSTAERASVVRAAVPGVEVLGSITLNRAVGGMNAVAVEIAAREGARTVWFPTVDSENESHEETRFPEGAKVPVWMELQRELRASGVDIEPVRVVDAEGALLPETRSVLRTIARKQLLLATGHLARDEIFAVVDGAVEEGVRNIVVTHPDFPSQSLSFDDQASLADKGALLERCFTTPYTGKSTWQHIFDAIRATGVERSVLSTDLGQTSNPSVEDGLGLMTDKLLEAGFSEEEIQVMAVRNTRRVAGLEA